MGFKNGDRVRIRQTDSEYTGCRGTVCDDATSTQQGVLPLGHMVAIDAENGVTRPFLIQHLEPITPLRVVRSGSATEAVPLREPGRR